MTAKVDSKTAATQRGRSRLKIGNSRSILLIITEGVTEAEL